MLRAHTARVGGGTNWLGKETVTARTLKLSAKRLLYGHFTIWLGHGSCSAEIRRGGHVTSIPVTAFDSGKHRLAILCMKELSVFISSVPEMNTSAVLIPASPLGSRHFGDW